MRGKTLLVGCIFAVSPVAHAQRLSVGVMAGTSLTDDYGPLFSSYLGNTQSKFSGSKSLIAGPMLEFPLPKDVFLELDGLYRELHYTSVDIFNGIKSDATYPTLTWEIPVLAKYKFSAPAVQSLFKPFLEAGPSFRITGNLNTNPSHYGFTGGLGVEFRWRRLNVAPVVRYTRWAPDAGFGGLRSKTDQLEFLVGFSDSGGSSHSPPFGTYFSLGGVAGTTWTNPFAKLTSPDYESYPPSGAPNGAFITKGSASFAIGAMLELALPKHLSLEVDALRLRLRTTTELKPNEGTAIPEFMANNATWEFPVLAKYKFARPSFRPFEKTGLTPFVELGPSFRLVEGQSSTSGVGDYGITASAGLEWKLGVLKIAPSIRYTHWGGQQYPSGYLVTLSPNQTTVLVGFSFIRHK